ncbi:MFS transporter [Limosilactobacillus fermentum]
MTFEAIVRSLIGTLLTGTLPIYISNFTLILLSRVLFGFFTGLFGALAISILSDYYTGSKRASMIGYVNAMGSIGAGLCSLLAWYLITGGWHNAFLIYLLLIVAIVLFGLFVPNERQQVTQATTEDGEVTPVKKGVPLEVYLVALLEFIFFIILMPMSYKLPELLISRGIGTATDASTIYALFTLIGIPVSIVYGWLNKKLGFKLLLLAILSLLIGFGILATTKSLPLAYLAGFLNGFGFGTFVPFGNNWLSEAAKGGNVNTAITIGMLTTNLGVFLSPIVMNGLSGTLFAGSAEGVMVISGAEFLLWKNPLPVK